MADEDKQHLPEMGGNFLQEDSDFGITGPVTLQDDDSLIDDYLSGPSATADPSEVTSAEADDDAQEAPAQKPNPQPVNKETEVPQDEDIDDDTIFNFGNNKEEDNGDNPEELDDNQDVGEEEDAPGQQEPQDEASIFQNLTEQLIEYGIFSQPEDGEEVDPVATGEDFKARWEVEKNKQVESQIYNFLMEKHGEEGLNVFNAVFVNGVNPQEYFSKYNQVQSVADLDMAVESNQERVYRAYYERQNLPAEKIEKMLTKHKELGELEEFATTLHEELIKQEANDLQMLEQQSRQRELERQQLEQKYAQDITGIIGNRLKERNFDGIPLTDKVARETSDYLISKKWKLPNGELLTDFDKAILELRRPENYELKVKIALLLKNGFDLSKVKSKAQSEIKDDLFNKVKTSAKVKKRNNPLNNAGNPKGIFDKLL